jgi:hypothetical protein
LRRHSDEGANRWAFCALDQLINPNDSGRYLVRL